MCGTARCSWSSAQNPEQADENERQIMRPPLGACSRCHVAAVASAVFLHLGALVLAAGFALRPGRPRLVLRCIATPPVGTIFVNLIRMTVIPLVASMLVASVGSMASSGALGRAGVRAAVDRDRTARGDRRGDRRSSRRRCWRGCRSIRPRRWRCAGRRPPRRPSRRRAAPASRSGSSISCRRTCSRPAADGAMLPVIVFAVLFGARAVARRRGAARRRAARDAGHRRRDAAARGGDSRARADRRVRARRAARVEARACRRPARSSPTSCSSCR